MWPFSKKPPESEEKGSDTEETTSHYMSSPTMMPYVANDVRSADIVSSALIGPGAKKGESVKLFASPQGQTIPRLGKVSDTLFLVYTPFTTNMTRAGELGPTIGDAAIKSVRVDFVGGSLGTIQTLLENVMFTLKICSQIRLECGLRDLPYVFQPMELISRTDYLEGALEVVDYIEVIDPVLVRIVMPAIIKRDLR